MLYASYLSVKPVRCKRKKENWLAKKWWMYLLNARTVSLLIDLGKVGLNQLNINYSPFLTFWEASSILSYTTFKKYYWNAFTKLGSSTKDRIRLMFQTCGCFYLRLNYTELVYFYIIQGILK